MYNAVGILKLTIQKLIILGGWSVNGLLYTRAADFEITICKQDKNVRFLNGIQN